MKAAAAQSAPKENAPATNDVTGANANLRLVNNLEAELNNARLEGAGDNAAAGWIGGVECAARAVGGQSAAQAAVPANAPI